MPHSFGFHLLEDGYVVRTAQELSDHKDLSTTIAWSKALPSLPMAVPSSLILTIAGTI